MVKSLLKIPGIDINALDGFGHLRLSPIGYAKNIEMIFMLVNAGADIKSEQGKKSLTRAMMKFVKEKDSESLEILLSHELLRKVIDINAREYGSGYNNVTVLEAVAF